MPYVIEHFDHFPHEIPDATESSDGMMSAADKAKLDGLSPGGGGTLSDAYIAGGGNTGNDNALGQPDQGMTVTLQLYMTKGGTPGLSAFDAGAEDGAVTLSIDDDGNGVLEVDDLNGNTVLTTSSGITTFFKGVVEHPNNVPLVVVDDALTATINATLGNIFEIAVTGDFVVADFENAVDGQLITIRVKQGAGSAHLMTFVADGEFYFPGGTPPTLTASVNAIDIFTFLCLDGVFYLTASAKNQQVA